MDSVKLLQMSEGELVELSHNAETLSFWAGGNEIKKISDKIVVKIGMDIDEHEFANQRFAQLNCVSESVMIPRVYLVFQKDGLGYLFMGYIKGRTLEQVFSEDPERKPELIDRVRTAVRSIHAVKRDHPGSIAGRTVYGYPWGNDWNFVASWNQLIKDMNKRLAIRNTSITFEDQTCVLCHMDVKSHNIIETESGQLCLLDWRNAAFYPECFEWAALEFSNMTDLDDVHAGLDLGGREKELIKKLHIVQRYSISRHLSVTAVLRCFPASNRSVAAGRRPRLSIVSVRRMCSSHST